MGDSTAMTIEFLRARLLSERSVSRSARQRADQLAKRVLELEEQLRIVTIQRKKAERAANEVLAILESQGVNDFPEVIDSSSDRDHATGESKGSDENAKGDETSSASRMDRSDLEDGMSGSELEVSTPEGRNLSWKPRNNGSDSSEKRKEYQARQRHGRSFISRIGASPQHLLGKSCRRIKSSRDMRATENGGIKAPQPDQTSDCADDEAQLSKETYDTEREKLGENMLLPSEDQNGHPDVDLYADGFDRDEAMEKALQQQAQLIVQYQAEENAQREWEEKYNENNSTELASARENEILIKAAEDKDVPAEDTRLSDEAFTSDKETKMNNENTGEQEGPVTDARKGATATDSDGLAISNVIACDMHPTSAAVGGPLDQQHQGTAANEYGTSFQEFEFPGPSSSHVETCEKQCHEPCDSNADVSSLSNSNLQLCRNEFVGSTSTESPSSSKSGGKFSKGQWSLVQSQIHRDLPEPPENGLGTVLDALQRAKLSLRQELNKFQQPTSLPPSAWPTATDSQSLAIRSSDTLGIPFGSAGLFRLPTDLDLQVDLPRSNYYDTGLNMPTLRSLAGFSDGYTLSTRTETRTAVTSARTGMPTYSGGYAYSATDLTARTASNDRLPNSSYVGMKREMSGVDGYNVYSADRNRLDMLGIQRLQE